MKSLGTQTTTYTLLIQNRTDFGLAGAMGAIKFIVHSLFLYLIRTMMMMMMTVGNDKYYYGKMMTSTEYQLFKEQ
jgi:hypothetical protein